jgi:hypothetical protein
MVQSRAWRLDDLVDELGVSHGSVWHMSHEKNYRKVASRYVSHVLIHAQKQLRVDRYQQHLERYEHDPNLLNRIVAIDETWLRSYDPKDPRSAAEWRLPTERG